MDMIGRTVLRNGKEIEEFVIGHSEHNYFYSGRPPLTHGCRECWEAYFTAQWALNGSKKEDIDQLESAIMHAKEKIESGNWDFKPEFDLKIEHEDD